MEAGPSFQVYMGESRVNGIRSGIVQCVHMVMYNFMMFGAEAVCYGYCSDEN